VENLQAEKKIWITSNYKIERWKDKDSDKWVITEWSLK
jgi:hypothetical protein